MKIYEEEKKARRIKSNFMVLFQISSKDIKQIKAIGTFDIFIHCMNKIVYFTLPFIERKMRPTERRIPP